jgi:phenylacetate-coenzyme A ligase PaaK-like adenylate-forming protein
MLSGTAIAAAIRSALENEHLSPADLAALQQRKLRDLVQFAASRSAFYGRLYQSIDLEQVALADLPPVTKEMIQTHFDEVVTDPRLRLSGVKQFFEESTLETDPWYLDSYAVLLTSGTTGRRGFYIWDATTLADAIAMGYRQSNRGAGSAPPPVERMAAVVQLDPCDATNVLMNMIPESVAVKGLIDIRQEFSAICRQLNDFQPTLLASYPYLLWMLCEAAREGKLHIHPRRITSAADVLTASDRHSLRAAFHVEPYNYYCSTEFPYLAWECDAHDGLHLNADYILVESVDRSNRPVPAGRLGDKVLVTNLSNRAMPLIRYEMSDQVEYSSAPCPCGCRLPRVRTVAGREEHILALPGAGGQRVRLLEEHVDDMVGRLDEVATYQVIQEGPARLTVNFVPRDPATCDHTRNLIVNELQECFARYGVDASQVQLDLRPVESLEPVQPGSSKVCRFWNRCR